MSKHKYMKQHKICVGREKVTSGERSLCTRGADVLEGDMMEFWN